RFLNKFIPIKMMTIAVTMLALTALFLASPWNHFVEKASEPNLASGSGYDRLLAEFNITYTPLDARTLQSGETIYEADPNVLPELSDKHSPLRKHVAEHILPLTDINLIDTKVIEGFGTLMNYTLLVEDPVDPTLPKDIRYFGMQLDGI